jgi:membrane associated rhomboid family serine protease
MTFKQTWGTHLIIAIMWWGFFVELLGSGSLSPDTNVMVSLGGLIQERALPPHNEWIRYITHLFLHGSFLHIIFNSIALYFGGRFLELIGGHLWFFLVLFLSGFGGGWLGMILSSPHTVLIGISGSVMGILGALGIQALGLKKGPLRHHIMANSMQIIVPSLVPVLSGVSYAAHLGGLIVGIGCGAIFITFRKLFKLA